MTPLCSSLMLAARESAEAPVAGSLAPAFWLGVVVGALVPLALGFLLLKKEDRRLWMAAAACALLGALILRVLIIQAGVFEALHL